MALSYLRPDADTTPGSWLNEAGGATLFASVDETVASDSDYIISSYNPSHDLVKLRLSDPGVAPAQPCTVRYRYAKKSGDLPINLTVSLLQGVTSIASWNHSDPTTSFATVDQVLTAGQFAAISDFTDLFLTFDAFLGNWVTERDTTIVIQRDGTIVVNERLT